MKKLKIVQAGWENYTGYLGPVMFINSVSDEPTTKQIADQLCASIQIVEIDDDNNEIATGVAEGMVAGRGLGYHDDSDVRPVAQEELDAETRKLREGKGKPPVAEFYTSVSLIAIADEKGIQGIREAAKPWGVRERSIPKLIAMILQAQADFTSRQSGEALAKTQAKPADDEVIIEGEPIEPVTADEPAPVRVSEVTHTAPGGVISATHVSAEEFEFEAEKD